VGTLEGGGGREVLIKILRSWQLSRKKREGGLYWPGPQQLPAHTPQITMEIYISDWTHKFQNKTGLDAKANSELYKSKRVCSAPPHPQYTVYSLPTVTHLSPSPKNLQSKLASKYTCAAPHVTFECNSSKKCSLKHTISRSFCHTV
jgi:hypothetical protein